MSGAAPHLWWQRPPVQLLRRLRLLQLLLLVGGASAAPALLWADRRDRTFVTVDLLHEPSTGLNVSFSDREVQLAADGGARLVATLYLAGEIIPEHSQSRAGNRRVELTLAKRTAGRWGFLLRAPHDGVVRTDWSRYLPEEEEGEADEVALGLRGRPAFVDDHARTPGLGRAIDAYHDGVRARRVESGSLPDAGALLRRAEAEHARRGGSFDEVVQQVWATSKAERDAAVAFEAREEAWARGDLDEAAGQVKSSQVKAADIEAAGGTMRRQQRQRREPNREHGGGEARAGRGARATTREDRPDRPAPQEHAVSMAASSAGAQPQQLQAGPGVRPDAQPRIAREPPPRDEDDATDEAVLLREEL